MRLIALVLAACSSGPAPGPAPAPAPAPARAPENKPAAIDLCRGVDLDIDKLALDKVCADSRPGPTELVAAIPKQIQPADFDWVFVELWNLGDKPIAVAVDPDMADVSLAGRVVGGIVGGVLGGEVPDPAGLAVVIDPGGVGRFRARCRGRCADGVVDAEELEVSVTGLSFARNPSVAGKVVIGDTASYVSRRPDAIPPAPIPKPKPEPKPGPPKIVPYRALMALIISGDQRPLPAPATRSKMQADKVNQVVSVRKLCIDATGRPVSVKNLKSSGYPAYDKLLAKAALAYRFRPFTINGTAVSVCTAWTIIFKP